MNITVEYIDFIIALAGFTMAIVVLKQKQASEPNFNAMGLSVDTMIRLLYFGVFLNVVMAISKYFNLI